MRLLKLLVVVVLLGFAGLTGYAYLGDMAPRTAEMKVPVELDLNAARTVAAQAPAPDAPAAADAAAPQAAAGADALD